MKKNYLELTLFIISVICFLFFMFQANTVFEYIGVISTGKLTSDDVYLTQRFWSAIPMGILSGVIGIITFRLGMKEHKLEQLKDILK